jgi:hypothetical protein
LEGLQRFLQKVKQDLSVILLWEGDYVQLSYPIKLIFSFNIKVSIILKHGLTLETYVGSVIKSELCDEDHLMICPHLSFETNVNLRFLGPKTLIIPDTNYLMDQV